MKDNTLVKGELVELIAAHGGASSVAGITESVEEPLFRVRVKTASFKRGDAVRAQRRIIEDARYTLNGLIEVGGAPVVVVRALGPWMRVQQREFVRFRLQAQIWAEIFRDTNKGGLLGGGGSPVEMTARIIDISAGGAQLEPSGTVLVGDRVQVKFSLPSSGEVKASGLVVRSARTPRGTVRAGVRFLNVPPQQETMILRWVYDQQIRKRRHTIA